MTDFFVKWILRLVMFGFALAIILCLVVWQSFQAAENAGEGILFDEVAEVPSRDVGLVFGCSKNVGDRPNLFFAHRIEAASALWKAGKVKCLLVSGDNSNHGYNEPEDMRIALIAAGVPRNKIVCDFAGLRTLDSVVRAKEIFGTTSVVLVSQKFHNERAAYIAKAHGLDVVGFNAENVTGYWAKKTERREYLARTKMWLDVAVLKKDPKFLGKKERLPL